MGISASLELDSKLLPDLFDWKLPATSETDYGRSQLINLSDDFNKLREHPEDFENVKRLLLGVDGGMTGTNIVAILSLLGAARRKETIFAELSNNSVAYFEIVLIILKYLETKEFGETEGRANLFLLGLAENCLAAINLMMEEKPIHKDTDEEIQSKLTGLFRQMASTTRKGVSTVKDGSTKLVRGVEKKVMQQFTSLNTPSKKWKPETTAKEATKYLMSHYLKCRFTYLELSRRVYPNARRGFDELEHLKEECAGLVQQFSRKASEYYKQKGAVFQIELIPLEAMNYHYRTEDAYNLSVALMDLVLPDIPENIGMAKLQKTRHNDTDVMLDVDYRVLQNKLDQAFPAPEDIEMNEYKLMTDPQQKLFSFVTSMFKPIAPDDDLVGEYTISYIRGLESHSKLLLDGNSVAKEKFTEVITYTREHFPKRVAELPSMWKHLDDTSRDLISCLAALEMVMVVHSDVMLEQTLVEQLTNF